MDSNVFILFLIFFQGLYGVRSGRIQIYINYSLKPHVLDLIIIMTKKNKCIKKYILFILHVFLSLYENQLSKSVKK